MATGEASKGSFVWVLPEAGSKTRTWVQGVGLGQGLGGMRRGSGNYSLGVMDMYPWTHTPGPSALAGNNSGPMLENPLCIFCLPSLTSATPTGISWGYLPKSATCIQLLISVSVCGRSQKKTVAELEFEPMSG